jgi:AcrR family transcriptional regulator
MEQDGEVISITEVAKRCGISHSLIYNRHPDIRELIKNVKSDQRKQALIKEQYDKTEKLVEQNRKLSCRLKKAKQTNDKQTVNQLMGHLQTIYSMYDDLLEERNEFAKRIIEFEKNA